MARSGSPRTNVNLKNVAIFGARQYLNAREFSPQPEKQTPRPESNPHPKPERLTTGSGEEGRKANTCAAGPGTEATVEARQQLAGSAAAVAAVRPSVDDPRRTVDCEPRVHLVLRVLYLRQRLHVR